MIKIPYFRGFDFERLSYSELETEILSMADIGWTVHDLGDSSDPTKKMYGLSLGDIENKQVIYFQAQIHGGHEWQTSHWALEFCRQIVNADNPYHREVFAKLKQKYAFYCFPCVNPYGYDPATSNYGNANNVRIDGDFDFNWPTIDDRIGPHPFSQPESIAIRDIMLQYRPLTLFCCHTLGGGQSMEVRPQRGRTFEMLLKYGIGSVMNSIGVSRVPGDGEIGRLLQPTAYNWAYTVDNKAGKPVVGCAIESGSLRTNPEKAQMGMTALLTLMMYVDNYYTNRTMDISG